MIGCAREFAIEREVKRPQQKTLQKAKKHLWRVLEFKHRARPTTTLLRNVRVVLRIVPSLGPVCVHTPHHRERALNLAMGSLTS